jgi:hypothetical protein
VKTALTLNVAFVQGTNVIPQGKLFAVGTGICRKRPSENRYPTLFEALSVKHTIVPFALTLRSHSPGFPGTKYSVIVVASAGVRNRPKRRMVERMATAFLAMLLVECFVIDP